MSLAEPVSPEIMVLAELGLIYPPSSLILVECSPETSPEVVFLEFVVRRMTSGERTLVLSLRQDLLEDLRRSSVPFPVFSRYKHMMESAVNPDEFSSKAESRGIPLLSYAKANDAREIAEEIAKHAELFPFIYVYAVDLAALEEPGALESLAEAAEKTKRSRKRGSLTFFVDEAVRFRSAGRRLEYAADLVYRLVAASETGRALIVLARAKFTARPRVRIEYSITKEGVSFELVREI